MSGLIRQKATRERGRVAFEANCRAIPVPFHACRRVPFNSMRWSRVRDHFGDQNVRSTFAGFSLSPNAGEHGGFYAVGFQMSRNSKNTNPTRTTIFRGSNTQLSVL